MSSCLYVGQIGQSIGGTGAYEQRSWPRKDDDDSFDPNSLSLGLQQEIHEKRVNSQVWRRRKGT